MRIVHRLAVTLLFVATVCGTTCVACCATSQAKPALHGEAGASLDRYDVVLVKLWKPGTPRRWVVTDDSSMADGFPLYRLILEAFDLPYRDQVSGLPKWAYSDSFDVVGKMDSATVAALRKLSQSEQWKHRRLMDQAVLANRFGLRFHRATRELPIYELVVSKRGFKGKTAISGESTEAYIRSRGLLEFNAATLKYFAYLLSRNSELNRIVINKTGLNGKYDFTLKWTPFEQEGKSDLGPSIFTALEEQLGLKLVADKGRVQTIVVDRLERPTPN